MDPETSETKTNLSGLSRETLSEKRVTTTTASAYEGASGAGFRHCHILCPNRVTRHARCMSLPEVPLAHVRRLVYDVIKYNDESSRTYMGRSAWVSKRGYKIKHRRVQTSQSSYFGIFGRFTLHGVSKRMNKPPWDFRETEKKCRRKDKITASTTRNKHRPLFFFGKGWSVCFSDYNTKTFYDTRSKR